MGRILFGIIAAVASFMLVDSLTCNKCSYALANFCLSSSQETCATNTSACFTAKATFQSISSTLGFNTVGCTEASVCNITLNGTLLGISYQTRVDCCSTDKCNPLQLSSAPSTKMTLTATIGAAVLASMWGSML